MSNKQNNYHTFLNKSQEAEKENEIHVGSRIVNMDNFMQEIEKWKACHEGKHISQVRMNVPETISTSKY